jgi:carotenoid cleavage dioxygenase-like enzyme
MRKAYDIGFGESEQELVIDELSLDGRLPEWIEGTLLRNGPGTFKAGDQNYRHWFDGLAMLHKFTFRGGKVSYANKFLECNAYREAMDKGKIAYSEFATDPCYSLFDRVKEVFNPQFTDSAKVNVGELHGKFVALGEPSLQVEFDPETLESVGVFAYDGKVKQHVTTVHPHIHNDEILNLTTRFGRVSNYRFMKLEREREPKLVAKQRVKEPAYIHSFGMSPNYLILTEYPFVVNPLSILFHAKPFIENFKWKPERGTNIYVFDRNRGELIKKFETDPFFAFHHVNAFEQKGELIFDIVAYPDPEIIDSFYLDRIRAEDQVLPGGKIRRYRLNPTGNGGAVYEILSDEGIELPRFDYDSLNMDGSYRYIYSIGINESENNSFYDQIVKTDLKSGKSKVWREENCFPGEPVFLPDPEGKNEDDGVNLSVVLDEANGNSFLLVLDSSTFTEIARATIPQPVLFGYHGNFYNNI